MLVCTVCGLWYPSAGHDRLDICLPCAELNFAGNPLESPSAREILDAYVDTAHPMTPRQVQALARLAAVWRRQEAEDGHDL